MHIWRNNVRDWENGVAEAWKSKHFGPSEDGVRSNGPWHAKLNGTMFWM
jgi:hypothetical protein